MKVKIDDGRVYSQSVYLQNVKFTYMLQKLLECSQENKNLPQVKMDGKELPTTR